MGIETMKLDATDQGQPLYEKFGFQTEQEIERWSRPGRTAQCPLPVAAEPWRMPWRDSDALVFGADRSHASEQARATSTLRALFRSRICFPGRDA